MTLAPQLTICGRFTQSYSWTEVNVYLNLIGAPQNLR